MKCIALINTYRSTGLVNTYRLSLINTYRLVLVNTYRFLVNTYGLIMPRPS